MLTPEIRPEPFGRRPQPSGGSDFDGEFFIDYSRLDDMQRQLIDRRVNNNMIVVGTAGAGKSLIALHKARQLATMGEDCAVIVFTKTLRKYFEDGLRRLGLENVYSYRDFVYEKGKVKYLIVDECQKTGVQGAMIKRFCEVIIERKGSYDWLDMSWVGDFNPKMMHLMEYIGASVSQTYVTYRKLFRDDIPFCRSIDKEKHKD